MDPLTHAASGAALMLAIPGRPATRLAAPLAALVCASPDIDLAFIHTPLQFLLLHRGITHSLGFMPFFAIPLAVLCFPLWRKSTPFAWSFAKVWLLCCLLIMLHMWLDIFTTYGTMIFLPFSNLRVRLNSIYMIDLLITVPLLLAICFCRKKPRLQVAVLAWILFLPSLGYGLNKWHAHSLENRFRAEQKEVSELHVLPDLFAPLFWRAIYREEGAKPSVHAISLDFLGRQRGEAETCQGAPAHFVSASKNCSWAADVYFNFAMLPVMENLPERFRPEDAGENEYLLFYDLRFGSGLEWVRQLLAKRPNADMPFLFMTELPAGADPDAATPLQRIRLRFSDSGRDSSWHKPEPKPAPTMLEWFLGIR